MDNGDIVVKDKNGGYRLDIPVLSPMMTGEEGDEVPMEGVEEGRPSAGSGGTGVGSVSDTDISGREKESMSHIACTRSNTTKKSAIARD